MEKLSWGSRGSSVYLEFMVGLGQGKFRPMGPWGPTSEWGMDGTKGPTGMKHYLGFRPSGWRKDMKGILDPMVRFFDGWRWKCRESRVGKGKEIFVRAWSIWWIENSVVIGTFDLKDLARGFPWRESMRVGNYLGVLKFSARNKSVPWEAWEQRKAPSNKRSREPWLKRHLEYLKNFQDIFSRHL